MFVTPRQTITKGAASTNCQLGKRRKTRKKKHKSYDGALATDTEQKNASGAHGPHFKKINKSQNTLGDDNTIGNNKIMK
jgi:hypothetical protein